MELVGKIKSINLVSKEITISLNEREYLKSIEKLKEDKLSIELKKYREKRSNDANSYCWKLCDLIAKELSKEDIVTKEEVYKDAILQIGTFETMIIEEKALENYKRIWSKQGLGFLIQEVNRKDKCVKIHCYYGSSTYNTKEMSVLIELLVQLAKSLEIETRPQAEINNLLESWDK